MLRIKSKRGTIHAHCLFCEALHLLECSASDEPKSGQRVPLLYCEPLVYACENHRRKLKPKRCRLKNFADWTRNCRPEVWLKASERFGLTLKFTDASGLVVIKEGRLIQRPTPNPRTFNIVKALPYETGLSCASFLELASPTLLRLPATSGLSHAYLNLTLQMRSSNATGALPFSLRCSVRLMDDVPVAELPSRLFLWRAHATPGDVIHASLCDPSTPTVVITDFLLFIVTHFNGAEHSKFSSRVYSDFQALAVGGNRKRRRTTRGQRVAGSSHQGTVQRAHDECKVQSMPASSLQGEMDVLSVLRRMEAVYEGDMGKHVQRYAPPWEAWKLEGGQTITHLAAARGYHHVLARLRTLRTNAMPCDGGPTAPELAELNGHMQSVAVLEEPCVDITGEGGRSTPCSTAREHSNAPSREAGSSRVEDSLSQASSCSSCSELEPVEGQHSVLGTRTGTPVAEQCPDRRCVFLWLRVPHVILV